MDFNPDFIGMLEEAVGSLRVPAVLEALSEPAAVSVRLNPFKSGGVCPDFLDGASPVPWNSYGYVLGKRPVFTLDPFFHSGVYYVQDSSAMFVAEMARRVMEPGDGDIFKVLDLCAAPGGKTTDLAASLRGKFGDRFLLVSNEVISKRASILSENVARWGDPNVIVTSSDPKDFQKLGAFFDMIVTDVPCSGEGMFRKDEQALEQWSADNVNLCSSRQRRIVADVWPALKDGGVLVYSTCTFNVNENDGNAEWICSALGASCIDTGLSFDGVIRTGYGYSLVPGFVPGEGQYCCALRKEALTEGGQTRIRTNARYGVPSSFISRMFTMPVVIKRRGNSLIAVPSALGTLDGFLDERLNVIASGCAAGVEKGHDFIPDEDSALCMKASADAFPRFDVDRDTALSFLHRDTFTLKEAPVGMVMVTYKSVPLGFVKNLGGRVNNLHPQGRRIRMDI